MLAADDGSYLGCESTDNLAGHRKPREITEGRDGGGGKRRGGGRQSGEQSNAEKRSYGFILYARLVVDKSDGGVRCKVLWTMSTWLDGREMVLVDKTQLLEQQYKSVWGLITSPKQSWLVGKAPDAPPEFNIDISHIFRFRSLRFTKYFG